MNINPKIKSYKYEYTITNPLDLKQLYMIQQELSLRYNKKPTLKDCLDHILVKGLRDKEFW